MKNVYNTIVETIKHEPRKWFIPIWIWRAIVTFLIAIPVLYVVGFVVGLLMLHPPHVVGKELVNIMY